MGFVYCEHLDDREEIKEETDMILGTDITLIRTESSDEQITKDNYANSGSGDPMDKYLDLVGKDKLWAFSCPICQNLGRDPTVYFVFDDSIEAQNGASFIRLKKRDGKFVRDICDEQLEPGSIGIAYKYV